jgi:hypothetical protein
MGVMTDTLRLVIAGDAKGAVGALRDVGKASDDASTKTSKFGAGMDKAANVAIGAGVALAGVIGISAKKTIAYGQAIDDIGDLSGLSAEATSKLAGELYYYDIGLESAGKSVKFFEKNLDEARQGQAEYLEDFERLGFSLEELQSMSDEDILFRLRDSMADLDDKTARTAITLRLFGKSGADMADWLDAAPEDMEELNEKLADLGLVWDGNKVKNWQDLVDAQRDMRISMLGLQMAIADPKFVGSLSALIGQFSGFLQAIRPIMPALPYLAAGLLAFGGAVKTVRMYQMVRDMTLGTRVAGDLLAGWRDSRAAASALTGSAGSVGGALRRLSTGGLAMARSGFTKLGGLLKSLPSLLSSVGVMHGLIAAGIAADAYLIYKAVDAWQELSEAIEDAKKAEKDYAENSAKQLDRVRKKYGENSREYKKFFDEVKKTNEQAKADAYKYPWWYGPGAWMANMGVPLPGWENTAGRIPGLAEGGTVKAQLGGTIIRAAEAGEDEDFVPSSQRRAYARRVLGVSDKKAAPAEQHVHVHIGQVVGTDRAAARNLADMVGDTIMQRVRFAGG